MTPLRDRCKPLARTLAACFRLTVDEQRFVLGILLLFAFGLLVRLVVTMTDQPAEGPAPPPPPTSTPWKVPA